MPLSERMTARAIYDGYGYADEKREAFDDLVLLLEHIVNPLPTRVWPGPSLGTPGVDPTTQIEINDVFCLIPPPDVV